MLFPEFRFGCLQLSSVSESMRSSVANTKLTLRDYEDNQFTLKCPHESQFLLWQTQLLRLFPESLEPTIPLANSISNLHKHTRSTSTSCYSFNSTQEEILTESFHGLSIVCGMSNVRPSFVSPRQSLSSDLCSPKLSNLPLTPSLIDAPELKEFMFEDWSTFGISELQHSFAEESEILNPANVSVSGVLLILTHLGNCLLISTVKHLKNLKTEILSNLALRPKKVKTLKIFAPSLPLIPLVTSQLIPIQTLLTVIVTI